MLIAKGYKRAVLPRFSEEKDAVGATAVKRDPVTLVGSKLKPEPKRRNA